jgi:hypothetical protein
MKLASVLLIAFMASGCLMKLGRFQHFDATAPAGLESLGEPVTGESCGFFVPPAQAPTVESAVWSALRRAPAGTVGLRDVKINSYYALFVGKLCYQVTGTPVK